MSRYSQVAHNIERLIRQRNLRPGDSLPSERELAVQLGVTYGTVRWANDLLARRGIVERRHGQGTFLAGAKDKAVVQKHHRLGLLYLDMPDMGSYLRLIAFAVQKLAQQAGYELVIEQMQTDRVLGGNPPEMIRRRSVDAVLLYGMVHDFHIEYFKQHSLPYLVLGNCSLSVPAPQVRLGATSLLREITRELLVAGRDPVWFEADPSSPEYHTGQEMLAGYVESIERHARQPSMHLCALEPERIDHVAQMLCRRGLENAALIAEHWPVALLPAALKAIHPNPQSLLYVPLPFVEEMPNIISGPNVVRWSQLIPAEEFARRAVRQMIDCLEGRGDQLHAISIEPTCKLLQIEPQAAMELNWTDRIVESFTIERYGEGCRLRQTQES